VTRTYHVILVTVVGRKLITSLRRFQWVICLCAGFF